MLGVVIRLLVERIRDLVATKSLEEKLGREVGSHEIYSIAANIEATEADTVQAQARRPIQPALSPEPTILPPQPAVFLVPPVLPEPMSGIKKLALTSIIVGFVVFLGYYLIRMTL